MSTSSGSSSDDGTYVDAAFRSSRTNEAYIFMGQEYVVFNYADNKVVNEQLFVCQGFRAIAYTILSENGIDCAFGSHCGTKVFLFSLDECVYMGYAPETKYGKIIEGPMYISEMFPCLEGTEFEAGIDAAFESDENHQAFLFNGNQYALVNYEGRTVMETGPIVDRFRCLKNTIFETGIDAAFASHKTGEAYLFKGDSYVLIDFRDDIIIDGVEKILIRWPSLGGIFPNKWGRVDLLPVSDDDDGLPDGVSGFDLCKDGTYTPRWDLDGIY